MPSKLATLRNLVLNEKGVYGARRVDRAADEIKNLNKLYSQDALKSTFSGDNARALMTVNPKDFERYSLPLEVSKENREKMIKLGLWNTDDDIKYDYIQKLRKIRGGFDDVPFLQINKKKQGLPTTPIISGHEGRHRNRAMVSAGEQAGLVRLEPRAELREPFPRRSQEEYIDALRQELDMTGNKVTPEIIWEGIPSLTIHRPDIDLPEIYKQGGAVSQDAMNLSVMNQKVQRKMGGGGAKSKNAPKFTEAFTQGLGPMLYGAARGTAAGLAGIGGDIEELARLGINYAGDKLQSRFPNMLDKRDVVGAKATLPTSEVVLSKIPSLKDFGAGPEARHSENMASKLGMYGLSNIAAPKAGKAVVQGVNATSRALAPKAGEMLENYMMRSGMALPMDVWHGSPHRFPPTAKNPLGEFDASKIGTGQGAQTYGHGLYVAENPKVANKAEYRDPQGIFDRITGDMNNRQEFAHDMISQGRKPDEVWQMMKQKYGQFLNDRMLWDDFNKVSSARGFLYKVDLPDEQIAKMLDWDKPLSEQAPNVQAAINKQAYIDAAKYGEGGGMDYYRGDPHSYSGESIYHYLAEQNSGAIPTSEMLREMGIPGIKYLDQFSRDAGEGTRNFVVFPGNEEMLKILSREKDGGLVHGKKNGGEAKKPFSNDFERRLAMAGSVMPSQREMEEALSPATVNSLLKRAADRRQGKAMQEEPERPEMQPEAEVWPSDPTFRQQGSAKIQQGLESIGFPIPRARSISENVMGVLDFVPFVGTPMSLQETKRNVERARDKGDQTRVVAELGLGALTAAAGLWGTKALAKNLASRIKPRTPQMSQAEYDRILREGAPKQLSAPELQRLLNGPKEQLLLNGPTEQRLLNAPAREKTVFEMQQELAQQRAPIKPDLLAEEYANGGEVTSDDLILIERKR